MMIADVMISGAWLTSITVAVIGAVGAAAAVVIRAQAETRKARKEVAESREVTIKEPVPEITTKRSYSPPSFSQHMDVVRRVDVLESDQRALRKDMSDNFMRLMAVGEERKDKIMEKIDDVAKGFHRRVDQLVREPKKDE